MNALDKVIGYFSPERAYRRARFRAATETFAYDGAKSGRRTDGWVAAGGDANTEIGASLISLRNRSRDALAPSDTRSGCQRAALRDDRITPRSAERGQAVRR